MSCVRTSLSSPYFIPKLSLQTAGTTDSRHRDGNELQGTRVPLAMAGDQDCLAEGSTLVAGSEKKDLASKSPTIQMATNRIVEGLEIRGARCTEQQDGETGASKGALKDIPPECTEGLEDPGVITDVDGKSSEIDSIASSRKTGPSDFELLKVIGMGAFGKVIQVKTINSTVS